jgi:hypothetical protein
VPRRIPHLGQRPAAAVRPVIDLIDAPAPGRAAYRGTKRLTLAAGDQDAARLATALDGTF